MPFQKGNKLGKGRPQGSKNKATDVQKLELQQMLFNIEDMKRDFETLDAYKKFDVRMKAMSFFYSRPAIDMTIENPKYLEQEFIVGAGEVVTDEQKRELYIKHGGDGTNHIDLPLFID
ncbi:MAG: hypothetical protein CL841_06055 [Crocinitomicaceae bacterium]|nr:hypothetical protein [Crocinitomicaceae bacterium]|tara:strand:- start:374 stop:727 length:354 start_codon:yes stop_codon:yes gene_type:complete